MKKERIIYGLLSPLFLVMGVCVYLIFRDLNDLAIFTWMPGPENALVQLPPSPLSNVVRHNLAGALWFVSGILFFRFVWFYKAKEQRIYVWCFYAIGGVLEISQLSERVHGTFDFLDLAFMGIGAFIEGLLYNIFVKRGIA